MQLFIDANIYLEYFKVNSSERLTPLNELVKLLEKKKIVLLIPNQTRQEYIRNRRQIAETARVALVTQSEASFFLPAIMDIKAEEMKEVKNNVDRLKKSYKGLLEKYDQCVEDENTDADNLIGKLFEMAGTLEEGDDVLDKAYVRYMKGNPPRKNNNSYGDAIAWETLLGKGGNDDLVVVTRDGDYAESYKGELVISKFLTEDWKQKTVGKNTLKLYRSLAEFVNTFENKTTISKEIVDQEKSTRLVTSNEFLTVNHSLRAPDERVSWEQFSGLYDSDSVPFVSRSVVQSPSFCPYCGNPATDTRFVNIYKCSFCNKNFTISEGGPFYF
jgi:hypothetical protein